MTHTKSLDCPNGACGHAEEALDGWMERYIQIGRNFARTDPDLFPSLVELVRLVASPNKQGESDMRALLEHATGRALPPPSARLIGDLLVLVDERFADLRDIDEQVERFTDEERHAAVRWARVKCAAAGVEDAEPTMPGCVARLYQALDQVLEARCAD